MAKPERRGGLGRGLGSLLPGSYESPAPVSPAPERQRVTNEVDEEAAREAPVSTRPVRTMVEIEEEPVKVSEPIVREAIIEESRTEEVPARGTDEVEIDRIAPNPDQPRTQFKKEEIEELVTKCESVWISYKGINGLLVIGPNKNKIFLPATGEFVNGRIHYLQGRTGSYWSFTIGVNYNKIMGAYVWGFNDDRKLQLGGIDGPSDHYNPYYTIRAVCR